MDLDQMLNRRKGVFSRLVELGSVNCYANGQEVENAEKNHTLMHWDFVVKEMVWLATDFQKERQRHIANARKIAKAVDGYHRTKEIRRERKAKDEIVMLKKTASKISRDIRKFWLKINKLIEFKQKSDADEIRQTAMDKHLVFLVKQTERYTRMLAENLQESSCLTDTSVETSGMHEDCVLDARVPSSSRSEIMDADDAQSINSDDEDEDEFVAVGDEVDDETTLIEEEGREPLVDRDEELAMLQDEAELPIEELRARYANMAAENAMEEESVDGRSISDEQESVDNDIGDDFSCVEYEEQDDVDIIDDDDDDDDDEFVADAGEVDDETTLIEEEGREPLVDRDEELAMLQDEAELPIEELRARYANMDAEYTVAESNCNSGLSLDATSSSVSTREAHLRLEDAEHRARSFHVMRPYLLSRRLVLREYQHAGLNWLVSLHERRLNGILADEMGLGKTIQTIALLAFLAAFKGLWGPHLVVVPTSCIVNWESEFKRWCPAFKVLTYYGSSKARKTLRIGWSKLNSFHVCITSYQLVVQDSSAFRRKRWYYMILDEAHNIKNFKSQRWQTLLHFNTQRRLLLTGTPLQNNLMELWSLMHFLMPHIFRSRKEFSYWFSNPLNSMVEGNRSINSDMIARLHSIMRPFLLRRLKADVAKQLPGKFEHLVMCKMSKRQMFLYEEFMMRSSTRSALSGGNFLGMMNILMQLRKVCNHPDLFEPRPISTPIKMPPLVVAAPKLLLKIIDEHPLSRISTGLLHFWNLELDQISKHELEQNAVCRQKFVFVEDMNIEKAPSIASNAILCKFYADFCQQRRSEMVEKYNKNYDYSQARCSQASLDINWRSIAICRVESARSMFLKQFVNAPILPELVSSLQDRCRDMREVLENYVFVIPKVIGVVGKLSHEVDSSGGVQMVGDLRLLFNRAVAPFYPAYIRQRVFFPDRKLVQFDSGKLQTLAVLLRDLKHGGHKCLIFTQMSRMLDILEIFLNIHAHTYVRLDGSTSIDSRQTLMDRFNSDPKLFCFILSTRSGGLGINLTGADTVIFYDSDWNPAMDAQAQDRAHRIGQTRDVHIYRLVCSSTVEENILLKARQKRQLDFLVMTEGNFSESSIFTAQGLKSVLGETDDLPASDQAGEPNNLKAIEEAMVLVEDADDVQAMRVVQSEEEVEKGEFDENGAPIDVDEDLENQSKEDKIASSADSIVVVDTNAEEKDMEKEFASWQAKVGVDFQSLELALRPVERYALRFRSNVEGYISSFAITEHQKLLDISAESKELDTAWDVETIEREKEEDEYRAMAEGELLATNVMSKDIQRNMRWYQRERSKRFNDLRRRKLTGESWKLYVDQITRVPFWHNDDTGEACYGKPKVIEEQERYLAALENGLCAAPMTVLIKIFQFLEPFPGRCSAMRVCIRWSEAARDQAFFRTVLPVESRAANISSNKQLAAGRNYMSIAEAVAQSTHGDTLQLSPGHYQIDDLTINFPLRIIGETDDPSRCEIELNNSIKVSCHNGSVIFTGLTFKRLNRKSTSVECPYFVCHNSKVQFFGCQLSNLGSLGPALTATEMATIQMYSCHVSKCSGPSAVLVDDGTLLAAHSSISDNDGSAVIIRKGAAFLEDCYIQKNALFGIQFGADSSLSKYLLLSHCNMSSNAKGAVSSTRVSDGCVVAKNCVNFADTDYRSPCGQVIDDVSDADSL